MNNQINQVGKEPPETTLQFCHSVDLDHTLDKANLSMDNSDKNPMQTLQAGNDENHNYPQPLPPEAVPSQLEVKPASSGPLQAAQSLSEVKAAECSSKKKERRCIEMKPEAPLPTFKTDLSLTFDAQVKSMIEQIQRDEKEQENIPLVLGSIEKLFNQVLPSVIPTVFGSSFTTLALKGGDIDIFLLCPDEQPPPDFIKTHGQLIYDNNEFTNVLVLHAVRVPLIKATHIQTSLNVDITSTSDAGVFCSRLLRHVIVNGDKRVRPLIMLIVYWAKKVGLCRVMQFSTFSLSLLVIFYLQCGCSPPILPPLYKILELKSNSWPECFSDDQSCLSTSNTDGMAQLVMGFFQYYRTFDFEKNVVSTFYGQPIPIEAFSTPELLPEPFAHYRSIFKSKFEDFHLRKPRNPDNDGRAIPSSFIFIQAPLSLESNVTRYLLEGCVWSLNHFCELMADVLPNFPDSHWLELTCKKLPSVFRKPPTAFECCLNGFSFPSKWSFDELIRAMFLTLKEVYNFNTEPLCELIFDKDGDPTFKSTSENTVWFLLYGNPHSTMLDIIPQRKLLSELQLESMAVDSIIANMSQDQNITVEALLKVSSDEEQLIVTCVDGCNNKPKFFSDVLRRKLPSDMLNVLALYDKGRKIFPVVHSLLRKCNSSNGDLEAFAIEAKEVMSSSCDFNILKKKSDLKTK